MGKSKNFVLVFILIMTVGTICIQPINGQSQEVTINTDGEVSPLSALIHQTGNLYTLTANISSPLTIEANNIVVNGGNYTIKGPNQNQNGTAINLLASNVTVKNFILINWYTGISGMGNNNTITTNEFINNSQSIVIHGHDYHVNNNAVSNSKTAILLDTGSIQPTGNNNLVTQNQITNNFLAFNATNSNGTIIRENNVVNSTFILALSDNITNTILYENNFANAKGVLDVPSPFPLIVIAPFTPNVIPISPAGQWDNHTVGNYWDNYLASYPKATEIDHTNTGNMPYIINITTNYSFSVSGHTPGSQTWAISGVAVVATAIDNYPLMSPISIPAITLTQPETALSTSIAVYLLSALVVVLIVVTVSLLLFRRHRKTALLREQRHMA